MSILADEGRCVASLAFGSPVYILMLFAVLLTTACGEPADSEEQGLRNALWENYLEELEGRNLPNPAPVTLDEWTEVCASDGPVAAVFSRQCDRLRKYGFPFPLQEVASFCMSDDADYGDPDNAPEYFTANRNAARQRWRKFNSQISASDVCRAYGFMRECANAR